MPLARLCSPTLFRGLCLVAAAMASLLASNTRAAEPEGAKSSLFDGKTLHGWTVEGEAKAEVKDGQLRLVDGNGWLRSDLVYTDFVWHIEWKAVKEAEYDSGIYIRTQDGGLPFPKMSHQINLLEGKEGCVTNIPEAVTTGLIKKGEWNTFDIEVRGDTVGVTINGKKAYSVPGLKYAVGHVGIQCEVPKGGEFLFRNLEITELGFAPLFNGKDLAGWEGVGGKIEDCWEVKDGLLVCNGKKGPWIRSASQYGDFSFRTEYRVSEGGNSGVYVRVPENGSHHRADALQPPAGFEVQVLDDKSSKYDGKLKDYQYSASVYDIVGASPKVCKNAGEWNTLEINCKGQHITIVHNGVQVVDATEEKFPLLKLRQTKGFLGLQNHSTNVAFRNVRIGPPRDVK